MIPVLKPHPSDQARPLSDFTPDIHREEADQAARRARHPRPIPDSVGAWASFATPVLRRRMTELRRGLPLVVSRHPLGSIVASFAAGLLAGKTLLSFTHR